MFTRWINSREPNGIRTLLLDLLDMLKYTEFFCIILLIFTNQG